MPKSAKKIPNGSHFLFFALTVDGSGEVPNEIQIVPFGEVKSAKGTFIVDQLAVKKTLAAFNAKTNDLVIDYEHQTLTGEQAPAAGWIKDLVDKGTDGIWAKVEWTPRGAEYIKNKEYRYLSPVIFVTTKDKRCVQILSSALTNTPAIDGMVPIINSLGVDSPEREVQMYEEFLKKLAGILGLQETATEEDIVQTITNKCKPNDIVANKEVLTMLDLTDKATLAEVKGALIALKNPTGFVRAEDFAALKKEITDKKRDELVALALSTGKISPAQKPWAMGQAEKDPEAFQVFINTAPQVVPLDKLPVGDPPTKDLTDEVQISVNKALGISDEEFKKYQ